MELNLHRTTLTDRSTIGTITLDGERICYSLERPDVQIPVGVYVIEMTYSPRFKRPLPLLDNVSGRTDIRIHAGNWPRDTEGCILVGLQSGTDMLLSSLLALDPLVAKIQAALDNGIKVTINVS